MSAEIKRIRGMIQRFPNLKLIIEWLPKNGGDFEGILSILGQWSCKLLGHNMLFWNEEQ